MSLVNGVICTSSDGSIVIETAIDSKQVQKDLNRLRKQIQTLESQLNSQKAGRIPLEKSMDAVNAKLEEAKASVAYLKDEQYFINEAMKPGSSVEDYMAAYNNKPEVERNLKEQEARVASIQKEWDKANRELSQYDSKIAETNRKLETAKIQAGGIYKQMASASAPIVTTEKSSSKMAAAMDRAKESASNFATRLKGVVTSALVFTVVSQGLAKFRDWMGRIIQTNDEASAAMARLRGSLLTLAQPLVNVLIPAFTVFVNLLTRIVNIVSRVVSSLFGTTVEQSAQAAENLYNESNAIESVAGSAEKASKSLAAFDEINQLSEEPSGGGGSGGAAASGTAPDFSGPINDSLTGIVELFAGAALLALGAILTFSGAHILLGIGLMVLGALAIWDAITSNEELAAQLVESGLNKIFMVIGPMIAVIGVVLLVTGNILLGLGLIIAGASIWAVGAAAGDEGDFVQNIQNRLLEAARVIGPFLAVIGVVFLVTGHIALGLGFIIAGIALFVVSETELNWENLQVNLVQTLSNLAGAISVFLAIIGILLMLAGQIPIGFGMLIAGIGLFTFTEVIPNWDAITNKVKEILEGIKNAVASAWNWLDRLTGGFLSDIWNAFNQTFGGLIDFIAGIFTGDWQRVWNGVKDIFSGIWNGLVAIAKAPINGIIALINGAINAINWVIDGINSLSFDLPDWLGGAHIGFNIGKISNIPYLAQGAVIPPNRAFMAVLGDQTNGRNLEAPEALIRQIVREETGGNEIVALLQDILEATRAGRKMYVDKKVLAQTAKDGINDMTIAAGRSVLLY